MLFGEEDELLTLLLTALLLLDGDDDEDEGPEKLVRLDMTRMSSSSISASRFSMSL
jgi:hypothetical protein